MVERISLITAKIPTWVQFLLTLGSLCLNVDWIACYPNPNKAENSTTNALTQKISPNSDLLIGVASNRITLPLSLSNWDVINEIILESKKFFGKPHFKEKRPGTVNQTDGVVYTSYGI